MLALVFVTEEEAYPFLQRYERGRFDALAEGEYLQDENLLVTITGTGKIKATLRTERLLKEIRPTKILHAGTCTSLNPKLPVGCLVAAAQVFEGDRIELAAPSYPRMPLTTSFDLPKGTLVTQDHTLQGNSEITYWQRIADISDMTGYAVAYVAATHGVPCQIVNVVSGMMAEQDNNLRKTLENVRKALAEFLVKQLPALTSQD